MFKISKKNIFVFYFLISSFLNLTSAQSLPAGFDKYKIETEVISKFTELQYDHSEFYRIKEIRVEEIKDSVFKKPGYAVFIDYETPTCANNYFKGLSFSIHCQDSICPFGMIYKKCY